MAPNLNWEKLVKSSGNPRVLVMLSGGKDSTCCLALLKDLGIEVAAIFFTHQWGWENSLLEARRAAKRFGIPLEEVDFGNDFLRVVTNQNTGRPCRSCKPIMYQKAMNFATQKGFGWICVGDNKSDTIVRRIETHLNNSKDPNDLNMYINRYLDCLEVGVPVREGLRVLRPLIETPAEKVEATLEEKYGYEVRKNYETGDKYFGYWREGCPIQYTDPGFYHTRESLDKLKQMNDLATSYARKHQIRASVHYPSGVIVTIPEGHEDNIRKTLEKEGLLGKIYATKEARPYFQHYIIEGTDVSPYYLKKLESLEPLAKRFAERLQLTVLRSANHQFNPWGVTYIQVISESHVVYQTWPENSYLLIDLLSCKKLAGEEEIKNVATEVFKTRKIKLRKVDYD